MCNVLVWTNVERIYFEIKCKQERDFDYYTAMIIELYDGKESCFDLNI